MIKGLGICALISYLILASQLGGFTLGFSLFFLTGLATIAGSLTVLFLTASRDVTDGAFRSIREPLPMTTAELVEELEGLALLIRRDGLLSIESKRREMKDPLLKMLLKRVMDGFEKTQVLPLLRNQAVRRAELIRACELYLERFLGFLPTIGLIPTLWMLVQYLNQSADKEGNSLPSVFVPFLLSMVLQLVIASVAGQFFDDLKEKVKLYYVIMEEGLTGIQEGMNSDLLRDKLKARLESNPKWNV